MANLSKNLESIAETELSKIGSRLTKSRREILFILEASDNPLTVNQIADASEILAQSSLYRNLTILEQAKLVDRVVSDHDFTFFELSEHLLGHHHHMRCKQCGLVIDIELKESLEKELDKLSASLGNKYRFKNVHHHLEFTGICPSC